MSPREFLKNVEELGRAIQGRAEVLGMNRRNLEFVYAHNERRHFPLADNKLLTKEAMAKANVPIPTTYQVYRHIFELEKLDQDLGPYRDFVIKPAQGRGGNGILVLSGKEKGGWHGVSGKQYSTAELSKHLADILFGVYSQDLSDVAIIEERIRQHPRMLRLSPLGLADVRLILFRDEPILAMCRIPTRHSAGRANLHQGAAGVAVELKSGRTLGAAFNHRRIECHPDTDLPLTGQQLPCWDEVLKVGIAAAGALPLKYLGVDISISETGPVLLEVNARPGLEIQNVSGMGLSHLLMKT